MQVLLNSLQYITRDPYVRWILKQNGILEVVEKDIFYPLSVHLTMGRMGHLRLNLELTCGYLPGLSRECDLQVRRLPQHLKLESWMALSSSGLLLRTSPITSLSHESTRKCLTFVMMWNPLLIWSFVVIFLAWERDRNVDKYCWYQSWYYSKGTYSRSRPINNL